MRSSDGVGMTPPMVLGTPYPWSSVIMSSTLGAPFGGTTLGGHHGVESVAACLMTPPNFGGGGGICFPSIVVVASALPNVPVTTWAEAAPPPAKKLETASAPIASFLIPAPKSIRILLASNSGLASAGGGLRELVSGPTQQRSRQCSTSKFAALSARPPLQTCSFSLVTSSSPEGQMPTASRQVMQICLLYTS